jgi:hypothetical protein
MGKAAANDIHSHHANRAALLAPMPILTGMKLMKMMPSELLSMLGTIAPQPLLEGARKND